MHQRSDWASTLSSLVGGASHGGVSPGAVSRSAREVRCLLLTHHLRRTTLCPPTLLDIDPQHHRVLVNIDTNPITCQEVSL